MDFMILLLYIPSQIITKSRRHLDINDLTLKLLVVQTLGFVMQVNSDNASLRVWLSTVSTDDKTGESCSGTHKYSLICECLDTWAKVHWIVHKVSRWP